MEPVSYTLPDAVVASGLSRSTLYRAMQAGQLVAVKAGRRTLILGDSLRRFVASLPPAEIVGTGGRGAIPPAREAA